MALHGGVYGESARPFVNLSEPRKGAFSALLSINNLDLRVTGPLSLITSLA